MVAKHDIDPYTCSRNGLSLIERQVGMKEIHDHNTITRPVQLHSGSFVEIMDLLLILTFCKVGYKREIVAGILVGSQRFWLANLRDFLWRPPMIVRVQQQKKSLGPARG